MTTGVYRLTFSDGSEYIGKSVNIEARYDEHLKSLKKYTAARKMQAVYIRCGEPKCTIIVECHADHIDFLESFFIRYDKPVLNTMIGCSITNDEFRLLQRHSDLLQLSTIQHIELIDSFRNAPAPKEQDELLLEIYILKSKLEKPWYKRIFN